MSQFTRILAAAMIAAFTVGPVSAATVPNASPTLLAQAASSATTGAVHGTVLDDEGAPIAGATIIIHGPNTYSTKSDATGAFAIDAIDPALYAVTISKPGYSTARDEDFAVVAGESKSLAVTMHVATLTSLHTIASVRTNGRGALNTSTATVNVVSSTQFEDQGSPQVTRVLNAIPGVQISLPSTSANAAVPGAITFPNIRGALSYETASLIDGHPVSVGKYGDYVTTFLNSFLLDSVEVIKGPGAMSPETNYAIGGTVNFRTKDPTLAPTTDYQFGFDNFGGSYGNFGVSDTVGRLGFVADIASIDEPSPLDGAPVYFNPSSSGAVCPPGNNGAGLNGAGCYSLYGSASSEKATYIPGTSSKYYNEFPLVACCYDVHGDYDSLAELLKFRYKLSGSTTATVSYLGSQTTANQNANTSSLTPSLFTPGASYTGTNFATNTPFLMSEGVYPGGQEIETSNEPIFQAEVTSTIGNDTVLARFYHAGIQRIINDGLSLNTPEVQNAQLWGTGYSPSGAPMAYDGQTVPVYEYNYYNQFELDSLTGYSFEYSHPFSSNNTASVSLESTDSTTTTGELESDNAYSSGAVVPNSPYWATGAIPDGSGQIFNTYLLRDQAQLGSRLSGVLSLYDNTYKSTYPVTGPASENPYASGWDFNTTTTSHFDERLGLTYRTSQNQIVRFAAGSAIAPPYIDLLSTLNTAPASEDSGAYYLQTTNAGTLKPETAFGYDLGSDVRLQHSILATGDIYLTNLYDAYITQTYLVNPSYIPPAAAAGTTGVPLYSESNVNLNNERYEGLELQLHRVIDYGLNWNLAAGLQRAYTYDLPPTFYCSFAPTPAKPCIPANYNQNLAIVAGENSSGNALYTNGYTLNGFSNQSIPYLTGNAEISYKFTNGAFVELGDTLYGKNNSLYEPPFGIAYATIRFPINDLVSIQISGDNIFNAYPGIFPINGGGVKIPLANGSLGGTYGNVLGPATYRFSLVKSFGRLYSQDAGPNG